MELAVSHRHLVGQFIRCHPLQLRTKMYPEELKIPPRTAGKVLHHLHLGVEPPAWGAAGGLEKVAGYTWTSGHDGLVKVMMVLLRMMVKIKKSVILTRLGGSQQDGKDLEATRRRSHQNLERFLGFKLKRGKIIEYMAVAT